MKKYLAGLFFVALVTIAVVPTSARAETTSSSISGMLELLQSLMKQVEALQKQLATLKGDISDEIRDGLKEGMTNDDIRKIQELLATDPDIYPKGLASGYYGPLTKEAVKKFQKRHGLEETGVVDAETKKLMQEYFKERTNGKFPPGLLRAPGIDKKIKDRMRERDGKWELDCDDRKAAGPLCKDRKDDDEDEDEDEDDSNVNEVEAKAAIKKANSSINSLKAAINEASDANAIEDAEDELDDAKDEYDDAQEDFKDDDFDSAYENAVEADNIAKQAIEELLEDDETIASSTASRAINDAKAAIEELDDAIDDTDLDDDSTAVEDAEDELDDAKDELDDAEDDYIDLEYRKAYDSAVKSEQIAEEALRDLKKAENNLLQ